MKEPFVRKNGQLWLLEWMDKYSISAGFTTSGVKDATALQGLNIAYHVGDQPDRVYHNREILANLVGIPVINWVFAQQLHTINIQKVTRNHQGAGSKSFDSGIPATDGLYTFEKGLPLATFYADCTPLYFLAPKYGLIGVAHAGWQGTVKGMMTQMLKTLKTIEGIPAQDIFIAIGPAIGMDAYRVDDKVIDHVKKSTVPGAETTYVDLGGGQYKFSPKQLNVLQALDEGVPKDNIIVSSYCTYTDSDLFYSHRRNPKSGRMMAWISMFP